MVRPANAAVPPSKYRLPGKIEQCFASLSRIYAVSGERLLQEIIVNATPVVDEASTYDNLDGGITGHSLVLSIPGDLFSKTVKSRKKLQERLRLDLNEAHNVRAEFFFDVLLEAKQEEKSDWRVDSGLLLAGRSAPSTAAQRAVWGNSGFRIFLSHLSAHKVGTSKLKETLEEYGASCFVAHDDILPAKQWEVEMQNGLATMDCFVALMTEKFHDSKWTDQEAGFAVARGVPMISVNLGLVPYGFLGKFQALTSTWENLAKDILPFLFEHERMIGEYLKKVKTCSGYDQGNRLARALPVIQRLGEAEIDFLVEAYNGNSELQGSFGFNGSKPSRCGEGLLHYINVWSKRAFVGKDDQIVQDVPF